MPVSEAQFEKMLRDVQKLVSPEVLEEMRFGAAVPKPENYMPSKTAVRSKRWRDKNRDLGNPYGVRVGQHWMRVGKAGADYPVVRVLEVGSTHALVTSGVRTTRIRLDRFRPEYQGYERVQVNDMTAKPRRRSAGGRSALGTGSSAVKDTSKKVIPATGFVASEEETNERRAA